jgi:flagellar protein FliO/FliZ
MSQSLVSVGIFLAVLVCLPFAIKWVQQRAHRVGVRDVAGQVRLIGALALGPHQRVVTVEVGPENARTWLTLGITGQSITCLHSAPVIESATPVPTDALLGMKNA